jgi:hypothetical protein
VFFVVPINLDTFNSDYSIILAEFKQP